METSATTHIFSEETVLRSPQLHVEIGFIKPIEPRHALFALKNGEVNLVYDDKYCSFQLVTFSHTEAGEITSMDAFMDLDQACFHQGQFFAGQTCNLVRDGNLLAIATIVEVICTPLSYWDWKQTPVSLKDTGKQFGAELLECFLINLEFELLNLGFTRDYSIRKPKTGDYALEIRLYSSVEALDGRQAQQILEALYSLCYQHYQLKPNFYQLDAGEHLENFECSFIIGEGNQYISGHLIVI